MESRPASSLAQQMSRAKKRHTIRGGFIGLAIGGATGGLLGVIFYKEKSECEFLRACNPGEAFVNNALVGGAIGGIAGLIIGNLTYEDRWNPRFQLLGVPGAENRLLPQVGFQMHFGK